MSIAGTETTRNARTAPAPSRLQVVHPLTADPDPADPSSTRCTTNADAVGESRVGVGRLDACPALPATVGDALPVPIVGGTIDYANFDHAASTPALVSVKAAVDTALRTYSSVHRGSGYAIADLAAHGPQRPYVRTEQGWLPAGDDRDLNLPRPW